MINFLKLLSGKSHKLYSSSHKDCCLHSVSRSEQRSRRTLHGRISICNRVLPLGPQISNSLLKKPMVYSLYYNCFRPMSSFSIDLEPCHHPGCQDHYCHPGQTQQSKNCSTHKRNTNNNLAYFFLCHAACQNTKKTASTSPIDHSTSQSQWSGILLLVKPHVIMTFLCSMSGVVNRRSDRKEYIALIKYHCEEQDPEV